MQVDDKTPKKTAGATPFKKKDEKDPKPLEFTDTSLALPKLTADNKDLPKGKMRIKFKTSAIGSHTVHSGTYDRKFKGPGTFIVDEEEFNAHLEACGLFKIVDHARR